MRRSPYLSLALVLVLGFGLTHDAWAKRNYGTAGCGLGSVLLGSTGSQISAATTNGSFYSQGFGITSGTLNCTPSKEMAVILKQEEFLNANLNTLQKEMAQGGGETVNAFADMLGCPVEFRQEAADTLAKEYANIFKAPGVDGVLDSAKEQLRKSDRLKTICTIVG